MEFYKSDQLSVCAYNETLSVVAMSVGNPDRSPGLGGTTNVFLVVNAKNSFGGYTGHMLVVVALSDGSIAKISEHNRSVALERS